MTTPTPAISLVDDVDEFPASLEADAPAPRSDAADDDLFGDRAPLPAPICAIEAPPPQPVQWVVHDLFTRGDVGLIVGDGGSFKSTAALHIAAAVAGGYRAFDRFKTEGAPVLIASAEDPASVIQMRLEAFVRGHQWDRAEVLSNVFYFALAGIQLKSPRWKRHLLETAAELAAGLIILDPFVDLSGLEEENSNSEAQPIMSFARQMARKLVASVIFVHHANKSSDTRTQARIRGAGTIANASRSTLFFEYQEAGILVEQLKMTYAEKLSPFMLTRDIESQPANRADWISARLATVKPEDARLSRAEEFALNQIIQSPGVLNSRGLRDAAKGTGIWAGDLDKAIRSLFGKHLIMHETGPRNEKIWYPAENGKQTYVRAGRTQHGHENDRADRVGVAPAQSPDTVRDRVPPKGGDTRIAHADRVEPGDDEHVWTAESGEPDDGQAEAFDA